MEELDNDIFGRTVDFSTDGSTTDTYQVTDPNDSNYVFTITFPYDTAEWYVYSVINQIPVRGDPNDNPMDTDDSTAPWASGRTVDRENIQPVLGEMYLDLDLGKPVWFIGYGTTGWIDATGAQV